MSDSDTQPRESASLEQSWSAWKTWIVIVTVALFFGVLQAVQLRLASAVVGQPIPLRYSLVIVVQHWVLLACLVATAIAVARRFGFPRHLFWPNLGVLAGMAVGFALLALAARLFLRSPSMPVTFIQTLFLLDLLSNSALVGTIYAFHFYRQAESRELVASQLHATLAEVRLKVLQAQLEPHFLFNTLNAISVLALDGNQSAVIRMVGRLRDLLRASLSHDRPQEVPLVRELEFVEGYLEIQRVRFEDRLKVAYDVCPTVAHALVPSMILQPLVENAVIHGISEHTDKGCVTIHASRDGATLRLEVRDTGPGFRPRVRARPEGIGLVNTRARLEQLYGATHRIEFLDAPGGGARVAITIPFRVAEVAGAA